MTEHERLFFALWPTAAEQKAWAKAVEPVLAGLDGKPVPRRNLHATLVFLGDVAVPARRQLMAQMQTLFVPRFQLCFDHLHYQRRSRLLWWGAGRVPDALTELLTGLQGLASAIGKESERRRYRPHLTLMRKLRQPPANIELPPHTWSVEQFALVRSELSPQGARYEVLRRGQLA